MKKWINVGIYAGFGINIVAMLMSNPVAVKRMSEVGMFVAFVGLFIFWLVYDRKVSE